MPKRVGVTLTKRAVETAKPGSMLWDVGLPGFGVRVTPAGARAFIVQYRVAGGAQARRTIAHYPETAIDVARAKARPILALAKAGRRGDAESRLQRGSAASTGEAESPLVGQARRVLAALLGDIDQLKTAGELELAVKYFPSLLAVVAGGEASQAARESSQASAPRPSPLDRTG